MKELGVKNVMQYVEAECTVRRSKNELLNIVTEARNFTEYYKAKLNSLDTLLGRLAMKNADPVTEWYASETPTPENNTRYIPRPRDVHNTPSFREGHEAILTRTKFFCNSQLSTARQFWVGTIFETEAATCSDPICLVCDDPIVDLLAGTAACDICKKVMHEACLESSIDGLDVQRYWCPSCSCG